MKQQQKTMTKVFAIASVAAGLVIAGCNSHPKYPDSKMQSTIP